MCYISVYLQDKEGHSSKRIIVCPLNEKLVLFGADSPSKVVCSQPKDTNRSTVTFDNNILDRTCLDNIKLYNINKYKCNSKKGELDAI